jgi:hypothetical protein
MKIQNLKIKALFLSAAVFCCVAMTTAQTAVFTYQGRFTDSAAAQPTNGSYEMQLKLFTTAQIGTGTEIGARQTLPSVQVVNGVFTVQLDAENSLQSGADIFLEIGVRAVGSAAVTILAPRQQVARARRRMRFKSETL